MSETKIYSWRAAIQCSTLASTTRLVLHNLATHMNEAGENCYPTIECQSWATGLSKTAVCKHLKLAEAAGYIGVDRHGFGQQNWRNHEYKPLIPGDVKLHRWKDSERYEKLKAVQPSDTPKPEAVQRGNTPSPKAVQRGGTGQAEAVQPQKQSCTTSDEKVCNEVVSNRSTNSPSNKKEKEKHSPDLRLMPKVYEPVASRYLSACDTRWATVIDDCKNLTLSMRLAELELPADKDDPLHDQIIFEIDQAVKSGNYTQRNPKALSTVIEKAIRAVNRKQNKPEAVQRQVCTECKLPKGGYVADGRCMDCFAGVKQTTNHREQA